MTFDIRVNGGDQIKRFEAVSFDQFKQEVAAYCGFVSENTLRGFFADRFQVSCRIAQSVLVCRV